MNPNPARFDQKKADSINATQIRLLQSEDFESRLVPYLQSAGVLSKDPSEREKEILRLSAPLVQERITVLSEAVGMLGFLFEELDQLQFEPEALSSLPENAGAIVAKAREAISSLAEFNTESIQDALTKALVEELGEKPRNAFGPVRVAISGRRVTPPLFESMEILGKAEVEKRLEAFAQSH